jgi:hypothetical protein
LFFFYLYEPTMPRRREAFLVHENRHAGLKQVV